MGILSDSIDLMLPRLCIVCKRRNCIGDNILAKVPVCKTCLSQVIPLPKDRRWSPCLSEPFPGNPYPDIRLYMPFNYDEFFSSAIKSLKFGQNKEVGEFLGVLLSKLLMSEKIDITQFDMVIPIPLSQSRLLERGYNQAEVVSEPISSAINVPLFNDVLVRSRDTSRQADIVSTSKRAENTNGAFVLNSKWDVSGQSILLVDDVATTGFTLNEAASTLLDNGANLVLCIAVCGNRSAKNAEMY